jgi:hypothetical protein
MTAPHRLLPAVHGARVPPDVPSAAIDGPETNVVLRKSGPGRVGLEEPGRHAPARIDTNDFAFPRLNRLSTAHFCLLTAIAWTTAVCTFGAEAPPAVPVDGEPFRGALTAATAAWQWTFMSGETTRLIAAADLVRWGTPAAVRRGPVLVLSDGGLLPAAVLRADREKLVAESNLLRPAAASEEGLIVPRELLSGIVFQLPADRQKQDRMLDRAVAAAGDSDRLILVNGDETTGSIQTIDGDTIRLSTDVGPVSVEVSRARALIFNPALRRPPQHAGLRAWVGFRDGGLLLAQRVVLEGKSLAVTLACGLKVQADPRELVYLHPLGGRATYLSDLKPAEYRFVPFFDLAWPYHADRNATGGRLRAGHRTYLKGLGVHSAARLSYTLGEPYQRFQAELAVDDQTAGGGSVRFRVFVDGRQEYVSGTIRGGDPPQPISVNLNRAKQIDLVVDYAERGNELDHADWLDVRLVR